MTIWGKVSCNEQETNEFDENNSSVVASTMHGSLDILSLGPLDSGCSSVSFGYPRFAGKSLSRDSLFTHD